MNDIEKVISELEFIYNNENKRQVYADAIELLKSQPQVVRCDDCKHYNELGGYCAYSWQYQANKLHPYGFPCEPDWFCADGERKDGEHG